MSFIVFHHITSGHFGWDGQKTLFLFEEICDGALCKAAESLEGEDCSTQVLLKCISLSICVFCCFYLLQVKSISWNKWRTLSHVLLGWNTPDKHFRTLEKCSSSCFAHFPHALNASWAISSRLLKKHRLLHLLTKSSELARCFIYKKLYLIYLF